MDKNIFHDRERAEEEVYFRQRDAKLIEKIRERAKLGEIAHALAGKLDVDNPQLMRRVAELGVTLDRGAAFLLAPLVQVAWADGHVSREEREVVLHFARERGIEPGSADLAQLLTWLRERPSDALFDAALEAIAVGLSVLPRDEAEERVARIVRSCTMVAEVPEGISILVLHHAPIAPSEEAILHAIRAKLKGDLGGRIAGTPPSGKGDPS